MLSARTMVLGATLTLGACALGPPPGPTAIITPGRDKDPIAFQQDQEICQQHAESSSGYGAPAPPAASAPPGNQPQPQLPAAKGNGAPQAANSLAIPAAVQTPGEVSYVQCMAARGDIIQMPAAGAPESADGSGYGVAYPYAYPYAYGYPFGYAYPYGYDYPFGVGFFGFGGGYGYGRYYHGGYHHGGWGHGAWGRGGWGHGGFHGGGFHGGGGHGGGGRH